MSEIVSIIDEENIISIDCKQQRGEEEEKKRAMRVDLPRAAISGWQIGDDCSSEEGKTRKLMPVAITFR